MGMEVLNFMSTCFVILDLLNSLHNDERLSLWFENLYFLYHFARLNAGLKFSITVWNWCLIGLRFRFFKCDPYLLQMKTYHDYYYFLLAYRGISDAIYCSSAFQSFLCLPGERAGLHDEHYSILLLTGYRTYNDSTTFCQLNEVPSTYYSRLALQVGSYRKPHVPFPVARRTIDLS